MEASDAPRTDAVRQVAELEESNQQLQHEVATLREQAANFTALADNAGCGILITLDPQYHVYANRLAAQITGYSVEELCNLGMLDLADPAEVPMLLRNLRDRMAGRAVPSPYEVHIIRKDGVRIPVEVNATRTLWHGQVADMVLVRDVSVTHQALAAAETSERRREYLNGALKAVLSITYDLLGCDDTDQMLRLAVELARERLGLERCSIHLIDGSVMCGTYGTSMAGETTDERSHRWPAGDYWATVRDTTPGKPVWGVDDFEYCEWVDTEMTRLGQEGPTAHTLIHAFRRPLGVFFNDNAISGRPLDPDQQEVVAIYCSLLGTMIHRQRSEQALRESERRFRDMADLLPDIVFETDRKLRLTYVNRAGYDSLGYCPADLARPMRVTDLLTMDQVPLAEERLRMASSAGRANDPWLYHVRRADGSLLPVEVRTTARVDENGVFAGFRGVVRDIGERQRTEQAQRLSAVGELAASLAHDFGNILTTMRAWAHAVQHQPTEEKWHGLLNAVLNGSDRGGALCWNLLRLADPPRPHRQPIALESPIESALSMAAPELEQHQITVVRHYHTASQGRISSGCVLGDVSQLEQVFLNLIINACHAMPEGGRLTLETVHMRHLGEPSEIVARVTDNGIGIPVENLTRIFEPFFSTRNGNGDGASRQPGGHGLGLSVSYSIIQSHGGSLTVQSELGVGSTFEVRLAEYTGPLAAHEESTNGAAAGPSEPGPKRVLVVESDSALSEDIGQALCGGDVEVVPAHGTRQALEALHGGAFDLIITELLMPGGGGAQVMAAARALPNPVPILLIGGHGSEALADDLLRWGAHRCFRKPFDPADLMQCAHSLLHAQEP